MQLATHFKTVWVPEHARAYLDANRGTTPSRPTINYRYSDLEKIAKGQIELEKQKLASAKKLLFCDTDLITIKIWSKVKYKRCSRWIQEQIKERHYDHYLLCKPDLPWEPDPQREHPEQRDELFFLYKKEMEKLGKSFSIIEGKGEQRLENAIQKVSAIFETN